VVSRKLLHGKTKGPDAGPDAATPPPPPPPEAPAAPPTPSPTPSPTSSSLIKSPQRDKHGRGAHPEDLPRDVTPALRPDRCDRCGHERLLAAEQFVSEEYDYVRAHVRIRRTVREVCRCARCNARVTPPQPSMPFDRSACTFEMMAWLLYAKCGLFLPLDRVRRDLERQGAPIPSATLTRWWQQGADLLKPIAGAVRLELLQGDHIHTDGTGLLVVFPRLKAEPKRAPARAGEVGADGYLPSQTPEFGQVLVFYDNGHAVYHYTNDKRGSHAQDFLVLGQDKDQAPIRWTGTITADAASVHDLLFAEGDRVEAGCNAHRLRRFRDEADKAPLLASLAKGFMGRIYELDAEARAENLTGDVLLAHR
jgi:transposase